jgi:hypothetical protein
METEKIGEWFQLGIMGATVLAGFIYGLRKAYRAISKSRTQRNEERFSQVNMRIWEALSEIRLTHGASRISLTQFHNGGKFVDGSSMRKMSISHQSCDSKIASTMQFRQDVLVSRFVEIIDILHDNDPRLRLLSNFGESNSKKFYQLHDTVAVSILPVYSSDSMLVYGYISVEWCDLGSLDKVNEKELTQDLENARSQIAFLLNSSKDYR